MSTAAQTVEIPKTSRVAAWIPLIAIPGMAAVALSRSPSWIAFWGLTLAVFLAMKWATLTRSPLINEGPSGRAFAYLFLWPGMSVATFTEPRSTATHPKPWEWTFGIVKVLFGLGLIYRVAPAFVGPSPMLAGWVGMTGIAFVVLFGMFDLMSLAWRQAGFKASPLMKCPICSTSVAEYWGRRWNLAFRDFAHAFLFRPLRPKLGSAGAMLAVFAFSGALHDFVISMSTRSGWGKPALFFLIQGVAVLFEQSRIGKTLNLGRGLPGRLFCGTAILGPSLLLFTRPFMQRVVLPTLAAVGAM